MLNKIKVILLVVLLLLGLYLGFSYLTYKNFSSDFLSEDTKVEKPLNKEKT